MAWLGLVAALVCAVGCGQPEGPPCDPPTPDPSAWWALAATLRRYDLEIDASAIDTFTKAYAGAWAALAGGR